MSGDEGGKEKREGVGGARLVELGDCFSQEMPCICISSLWALYEVLSVIAWFLLPRSFPFFLFL